MMILKSGAKSLRIVNFVKMTTMKVLMINGSPRPRGNTSIALAEIAGQLEKLGIESEIVWIGNKPLRGCIACNTCKGKPGACVFDDDVCNGISAKMNGADALHPVNQNGSISWILLLKHY